MGPGDTAPTWAELVGREPLLAELLAQAGAVIDEGHAAFCANNVLFDTVLPVLSHLVGLGRGMAVDPRYLLPDDDLPRGQFRVFGHLEDAAAVEARDRTLPPDPVLDTREAYEVAHEVIHAALPVCRNCLCAWG